MTAPAKRSGATSTTSTPRRRSSAASRRRSARRARRRRRRKPLQRCPGLRRARRRSGSATAATITSWRRCSGGSAGSRPSSIVAAVRSVNRTTRQRRRASRSTWPARAAGVGLEQRRLEAAREGSRERCQAGALQQGARHRIRGDQVDPVAGAGATRGQQQGGVERGVEARGVADAGRRWCARCRARGSGAGRARAGTGGPAARYLRRSPPRARGGPPVDRPHVVAAHVLAQAVELGAATRAAGRDDALDDAQPGELLRQQLAGRERRLYAEAARARSRCAGARRAPAVRTSAR